VSPQECASVGVTTWTMPTFSSSSSAEISEKSIPAGDTGLAVFAGVTGGSPPTWRRKGNNNDATG
jgi:hypothetical protein